MMTIQDLGSVGELLAAIATVATLGYLAHQVRLNAVHSRAYTQRDIPREITADHSNLTKLPSVVRRGLSDISALGADEKVELARAMLPRAALFEATFKLHESGLVDRD